jgi:hypothetical protein
MNLDPASGIVLERDCYRSMTAVSSLTDVADTVQMEDKSGFFGRGPEPRERRVTL